LWRSEAGIAMGREMHHFESGQLSGTLKRHPT
jgi:hypothetical protein